MLKIGEIAKKTGISIRSLRHYDAIGLLKPKTQTAVGYRLYNKEDIYRLQQIVSLQQMKFSLKQIKTMLNQNVSLKETLTLQREFLRQQLMQHQSVCRRVDQLLQRFTEREPISLELIYQTMEAIKRLEKYYTPVQLEAIQKRPFHRNEKAGQKYSEAWDNIFAELRALQTAGVAATSPKTRPLAKKARALIAEFTGGDKGIEHSIQTMYQQEGGGQMLRSHGLDVNDELSQYYETTLQTHKKI